MLLQPSFSAYSNVKRGGGDVAEVTVHLKSIETAVWMRQKSKAIEQRELNKWAALTVPFQQSLQWP